MTSSASKSKRVKVRRRRSVPPPVTEREGGREGVPTIAAPLPSSLLLCHLHSSLGTCVGRSRNRVPTLFYFSVDMAMHRLKGRHDAMVPSEHTLCAMFPSVLPPSPSGNGRGRINWFCNGPLACPPAAPPLSRCRPKGLGLLNDIFHPLSLSLSLVRTRLGDALGA